MGDVYACNQHVQLWINAGRAITPGAETKFQIQPKQAEKYIAVAIESVKSCYDLTDLFVWDLAAVKIPYLHLIAALHARKKLRGLSVLTGQYYQVTTYQTTVGAMLIPENHRTVNN